MEGKGWEFPRSCVHFSEFSMPHHLKVLSCSHNLYLFHFSFFFLITFPLEFLITDQLDNDMIRTSSLLQN